MASRVVAWGTETGVSIDFSRLTAGGKTIVVYNLLGQVLATANAQADQEQVNVPFQTNASGYVVVHITGDTWVANQKVYCER